MSEPWARDEGRYELYIYWKIPVEIAPEAVRRVREAQRVLRRDMPGLHARLLVRTPAERPPEGPDATGSHEATLMEVYGHPDGLPVEMCRSIDIEVARTTAHVTTRAGSASPVRHI